MFDDWTRLLPFRRPSIVGRMWIREHTIRVDEFHDQGTSVVRAELPGIDPDKDVELTVCEGMLRIEAERREEDKTDEKGYLHHKLRYGSFTRTLPLPEGVSESDIEASYKDGILEIRVPTPEPAPRTKIPVAKSSIVPNRYGSGVYRVGPDGRTPT